MPRERWLWKQRPSIVLDAGYVPISSTHEFHREHRSYVGLIVALLLLLFISLINLSCLFWFIFRTDWSQMAQHSKEIHFNQSTFSDWIYSNRIAHAFPLDLSSDEQIDLDGDHNSILVDRNEIRFHADAFHWNKTSSTIDFSHLQRFHYDSSIPTRVHLPHLSSRHIHHHQLYLHAHHTLKTLPKTEQIYLYSDQLNFVGHRHSSLRFRSGKSFHLKSDVFYLDLPHYPLFNRSSSSTLSRLCLCDRNRILFLITVDQLCPDC